MNLIEFVQDKIKFPSSVLEQLIPKIKTEIHQKGTVLFREGEYCRKVFFVEKGCLRFFYYDENGKDITHWFIFEGEFVTEVDSIFSNKPSEFYLETLEDCILQTFIPTDVLHLAVEYQSFTIFKDMMFIKTIVDFGEKIKDLQFRDAKTRYDNLVNKYPDILMRIPLGYIASYLGITQPSLSRIRRQR